MVVARRADEIVDIAARLFYERGYQSVSTRALAQAAGIQGGSLYHHFASKEEILYRIVQYGSGEFFAGLLPLLDEADRSYRERLARFVRGYITDAQHRRDAIAVLDLLKGVDAWMREPGRLGRRQVADTYAVLILQLMGATPS